MNNKIKRNFFIDEEIDIIIKNVKLYPTNLRLSFNISSQEIEEKLCKKRPVSSIHNKYYFYIRHNYTIFTNVSSNGEIFVNTKNTKLNTNQNVFEIIKDFKILSYKDKKLLIDTLMSNL